MAKASKENKIEELFHNLFNKDIDKEIISLIIDNKSSEEIIEYVLGGE